MKKIKPIAERHRFRAWLRRVFGIKRPPRVFAEHIGSCLDEMHDFGDAEKIAEALRQGEAGWMKDHERIFFALCYNLRDTLRPRDVVNLLADTIPHKRCWYYLEKWSSLRFYNYGVTLDLGWFEPEKLPPRYAEIVKEESHAT